MKNLKDFELNELKDIALSLGESKFRGEQLFNWLWKHATIDEMTNIPVSFRRKLKENGFFSGNLEVAEREISKDGTRKYLFVLEDGNAIESVFMKYKYGNTVCISSQAGCRMGCKFCASTLDGLRRNLSPGEMVEQILAIEADTGETVSHVVVMGTGEPFDNYDNLAKFLRLMNEPKGKNMSMRNITVSTCGLIPVIKTFQKEFPQANLAISLHAPNDEVRKVLMPIAKKYSMDELLEAAKEYTEETSRRITFEYALSDGINDSKKDALELVQKLKGMLCHVNLIPLNRVSETGLMPANEKSVDEFREVLEKHRIPVTVRRELGADISGACGQLRLKHIEGV